MERYALTGQCFLALGKPKLLIPIIIMRLIVLFSLAPLMNVLYGLQGVLWVIATGRLFSLPLLFYFMKKYGLLDIKREIRVLPIFIIGCVCGYILEMILT